LATRVRNVSGASGAIVIHGIKEFRRDLKAAVGNIKDMRQVNLRVGNVIVGEARRRSTLGPSTKGHIRDTIKPYATTRKAGVSYGSARNPYPFAREFGWKKRPYTEGPVIYPAIAAKGDEVIERYGEFLDRVFNRAYPN
jgi:hypothetical protein